MRSLLTLGCLLVIGCESSSGLVVSHDAGAPIYSFMPDLSPCVTSAECRVLPHALGECTAMDSCLVNECDPGYADCDQLVEDGCEVNVANDVNHCGDCLSTCPHPANGSAACISGMCGLSTCEALFGDCDQLPENGCEKNLSSDVRNCGKCGFVCKFANGAGTCAKGECVVTSCHKGFGDCDGNGANGCETNLASSRKSCGVCGMACSKNVPACSNGVCAVPCNAVSFAPFVDYPSASYVVSMALGDFNGDGAPDVAVAGLLGNTVDILLNNGTGKFAPRVSYLAGVHVQAIAAGDLDGDGSPDLVAANFAGNKINVIDVLLNNGNGTFAPAVTYAGGNDVTAMALGDLDGDGQLDIALVDEQADTVNVLLNRGKGGFAPPVLYSAGINPASVAIGDFDLDGTLDLAVANISSNDVSVFLNNGDGTFKLAVDYATGSGASSVVTGDLDGDGDLDLAVANQHSNDVSVLLNLGNGAFAPAVNYPANGSPTCLALGDLDNDGIPDLAVGASLGTSVDVFVNLGNGMFGMGVPVAAGSASDTILLGDLNGDGRQDLAVTAPLSNSLSVLINGCN